MTEEARRGRLIVLIIIAALLVPNLAVMTLTQAWEAGAFRFAIAVAMSFFLWRGYSAARSYLAFSLGLAALLAALSGIVGALVLSWTAIFLLLAPVYAWGAWALWSSPKVEAYIEHCERGRNPDMSFNKQSR